MSSTLFWLGRASLCFIGGFLMLGASIALGIQMNIPAFNSVLPNYKAVVADAVSWSMQVLLISPPYLLLGIGVTLLLGGLVMVAIVFSDWFTEWSMATGK